MRKRFLIPLILMLMLTPSALAQTRQGGLSFHRVRSAMEAGVITHMSAVPETQTPETGTPETPATNPRSGTTASTTPTGVTTPVGPPTSGTP
ncbi:MAG: hypothetical protein IJ174_02680, partial [Clostridia bacterium]|nr:hypothetical protein [Clostridia bacterium]